MNVQAVRLACMSIATSRPPTGTVVDPHHQHPEGWQLPYKKTEGIYRHEEGQREPSRGDIGCPQVLWKEVPRAPQHPHDEPGHKDAVARQEPGHGEPSPAELLQDAHHKRAREIG